MSHGYQAVGWNRQKRIYDVVLGSLILLSLALFTLVHGTTNPHATLETLLIRAFGATALGLLHVILSIGPLARLDPRFLPLLYNRRHMGVSMFLLALAHGVLALAQFHALGDAHPLVSLFSAETRYGSFVWFPFQPLGFLALVILFALAATSHDFWLANLTAPVWKALHFLVYLAYALVVAHVALGALQAERHPLLVALFGAGVLWVVGLQLIAGWRERGRDREHGPSAGEPCVDVCGVDEIEEKRARVVTLGGERVAVFRYDGKVSAISNLCRHQNGPLGEGRIIDGCVTCPWHGYQYRPDDGRSPPPFEERVATYRVRVEGRRVLVDPSALPRGTRVEPASIGAPERKRVPRSESEPR